MTIIKARNYKQQMVLLIAIATIARVIVASSLELNSAEVYYWAYSLKLQWNYFDHPPVVAWLIRFTTINLLMHDEIFVRLGAIVSSAGSGWVIYKIATNIYNQRAGWFAALLFTSSLYGSLISGAFILPDSPQVFFWLAGLLVLIKISRRTNPDAKLIKLWCLFGVIAGLCIMSKVHGVFLWIGVILYAIVINRNWFKHPGIYLACFITLIIISPIIIWNLRNNFVSYQFHSGRVSVGGAGIHLAGFFKQLLQVIFLTTNPVNFFLICTSLGWSLKMEVPCRKKDITLLLFCSVPLIAGLLFVSLFRDTLAHWSGPAYCVLLILPALKLAAGEEVRKQLIPVILKVSLVYITIVAVSEILVTNFYPGTTSSQHEGIKVGSEDLTLDMYGWKEVGMQFDSLYKSDLSKKIMPSGAPIIVTNWYPAAHIDFYIANKTNQQTIGIGSIFNLHQYYWMNHYKKKLQIGDSAYYIVPSNLFDYKIYDALINSFVRYELASSFPQYRGGVVCKQLYIFRLKGYKGINGLK